MFAQQSTSTSAEGPTRASRPSPSVSSNTLSHQVAAGSVCFRPVAPAHARKAATTCLEVLLRARTASTCDINEDCNRRRLRRGAMPTRRQRCPWIVERFKDIEGAASDAVVIGGTDYNRCREPYRGCRSTRASRANLGAPVVLVLGGRALRRLGRRDSPEKRPRSATMCARRGGRCRQNSSTITRSCSRCNHHRGDATSRRQSLAAVAVRCSGYSAQRHSRRPLT